MKMTRPKLKIVAAAAAAAILASACSVKIGENTSNDKPASGQTAGAPAANANQAAASPTPPAASASACTGFKSPGKVLVAKQTFPFDHEPYPRSCFVTFASKDDMVDDKDLPRGSTFHIYTDGKEVFEFPDAFGGQSACWVEAISFDDLNADGKTDVVMAGKCLGAKDAYPTNAVYENVGRGFVTNEEANSELDELKTAEQIKSYVKKNVRRFFS